MRLPGFPFTSVFGIVVLLAIAASTYFVEGLKYSIPAFAPFLLLITLGYWIVRRRDAQRASGQNGAGLRSSPAEE
jgi:hypothetical protein